MRDKTLVFLEPQWAGPSQKAPSRPRILRNCRQIRNEARQLCRKRSRHTFIFGRNLPRIPNEIGKIQHIEIRYRSLPVYIGLDLSPDLRKYKLCFTRRDDVPWFEVERVERVMRGMERLVNGFLAIRVEAGHTLLTKSVFQLLLMHIRNLARDVCDQNGL